MYFDIIFIEIQRSRLIEVDRYFEDKVSSKGNNYVLTTVARN